IKFHSPLFFLTPSAQKEKLAKEKRHGEFRALRSATQGSALRIRNLLKKVDENFSSFGSRAVDEGLCDFVAFRMMYNFVRATVTL
ncbi:MAG: hypothetical protein ACI3XI_03510, partial [Eubacteriales bacterium]